MIARSRRFLLRYALMARNARRRIPELVDYCRRCGIESVMVITESHSMHLRHRTIDEAETCGGWLMECGEALRAAGIEFGLNLWLCLGHHDAALSSNEHFGWRPMIGADGSVSARSPCPMDARWQVHMTEILRAYARPRPDYLFIDDDFRWHNHLPVRWGCYCEEHLKAFGQQIGQHVDREGMLEMLYGHGRAAPPARTVWHALLRENFEQLAGVFERAIHATSPDTSIGLMTSEPKVHSAEGWRWDALTTKFAGTGKRPLVRPTMGCYREFTVREALEGVHEALATRALLPPATRITPELECSPFTRFNKSAAHVRLQLALSYFCVSPECTLDLHSFTSPELEEEPAFGELLRRGRPYFDRLAGVGGRSELRGINAPIVEAVADHVRSRAVNPEGVVVQRPWETCLPQLGVPVCYSEVRHGDGRATVTPNDLPRAVSGDLPLAVSDATLRIWLSGPLLLDATAAECFELRGYGEMIGVQVGAPVGDRHLGCEEILDPAFGEVGTWMPVRHMSGRLHEVKPREGARVISRLLWGDEIDVSLPFGAGIVLFENPLGGRVAVLPYDGQTDTLGSVQFRSYHRQRQLHAIIAWLAPAAPYVGIIDAANVAPFWKRDRDGVVLGLANLSLDPMPLSLLWRNLPKPKALALETFDAAAGVLRREVAFAQVADRVRTEAELPPWQLSLLHIEFDSRGP